MSDLRMPAGLPVTKLYVTRTPRTMDPSDPASLYGSSGLYDIHLYLSCPGSINSGQSDAQRGDSLVAVPQAGAQPDVSVPQIGMDIESERGVIHLDGYVNGKGRLAKVVAPQVQAKSFSDAELQAERALSRVLSQFAVRFNIPTLIERIESVERATKTIRFGVRAPFLTATFPDNLETGATAESMFYASLYHEALKSNSEIYQFLCFYKIVEALLARRRRIAEECKRNGREVSSKDEVFPDGGPEAVGWLNQLFDMRSEWGNDNLRHILTREARGRKFSHVINSYLSPLRLRIAHSVLGNGELTLMADEVTHIGKVYYWLGTTMCIARAMLKAEFPEAQSMPTPLSSERRGTESGSTGADVAPVTLSGPTRIGPPKIRVGRNQPCPCGSKKKYKKCHGQG